MEVRKPKHFNLKVILAANVTLWCLIIATEFSLHALMANHNTPAAQAATRRIVHVDSCKPGPHKACVLPAAVRRNHAA